MDHAWTTRDDPDFGTDTAEDGPHTGSRSELYVTKAREMRRMARLVHNPLARREFIALARGYDLLAERSQPDF
jgi:hypothetical protein